MAKKNYFTVNSRQTNGFLIESRTFLMDRNEEAYSWTITARNFTNHETTIVDEIKDSYFDGDHNQREWQSYVRATYAMNVIKCAFEAAGWEVA
jgi:hypothetical protein